MANTNAVLVSSQQLAISPSAGSHRYIYIFFVKPEAKADEQIKGGVRHSETIYRL